MHPRKIIRHAIVDAIKAAGLAVGDRVWAGQEPPIDIESVLVEEGPVALVYTRRDRAPEKEYPDTGFGSVRREVDLCVEIIAAGNVAVDDKLDDLADAVETLIDGFEVPGQPATEIRIDETNVEVSDIGGQTIGGAFLMYRVCYWRNWRQEPEEDSWFPEIVLGKPRGDAAEQVASCLDCEDGTCP